MQITQTTDAENQNLVTTVLGTTPTLDCLCFLREKKYETKQNYVCAASFYHAICRTHL
jgi:hypothetical protein